MNSRAGARAPMTMERVVEPEILDELPANDPRAIRSRRDLRRVNLWMGNARILARALQPALASKPNARIVELGCGDGSLLLKVVRQFPNTRGEAWLVDRAHVISSDTQDAFARLGWKINIVTADIFEWLSKETPSDCIMANLFLHHFSQEQLSETFMRAASQTKLFAACDPQRIRFFRAARRALFLIGCNDVTRHDAEVSIRAGFRDDELTKLWPANEGWDLRESTAGLFSHLFVAKRK